MSHDISVFHSSEVDDPAVLAPSGPGWYIGGFIQNSNELAEASGPYPTEAEALAGMVRGDWLTAWPINATIRSAP